MTVINLSIAANADDGRWNNSVAGGQSAYYANNESAFGLGAPAVGYDYVSGWFRFTGVQFSGTPTISSAILTLTDTGSAVSGSPGFVVCAIKSDDPTAPTDQTDAMGRALTTATVSWSPSSGAGAKTVDITTIIQEIANAYDYVGSAKAFAVYVLNPGTAGAREYTAKDGGVTVPTLDITYTAGGGAQDTPELRTASHHMQQLLAQ